MPIRIEHYKLSMTVGADSDWHPLAMCSTAYLNRNSGAIVLAQSGELEPSVHWEYGPEFVGELLEGRMMVDISPGDYLRIPSMSHGEHHAVMQDFLESDLTTDMQLKSRARDAYWARKSIGAWLKEVPADAANKYFDYKSAAIEARAENFLREHGIDFMWE